MVTVCPNCLSPDLRISHFRIPDLARLLILQYPVRCRNCRERAYMFLHRALRLSPRDPVRPTN
jgi:hypothetical protein